MAAASGAVTRTIRVDRDLRDVMVSGDKLVVTRFRSAELIRLDSAGAMASWSLVPLGLHKAMTPGIQVAFVAPSRGERVVALARNLAKHAETFSNRVELVGAASGRLLAHGLLTYRIVVGEKLPA